MKAKDLRPEFTAFRDYNKSRHLSPKTIHSYNQNLGRFYQWFTTEFGEEAEVTPRHIRAFMAHRFDVGNKLLTVRTYIIALAALFSFLVADERITQRENPMRLVKRPKKAMPDIEPLTPKQIHHLLDSFHRDSPVQYRDFVMCVLILDTGLRVGEMIGLTVDDLDLSDSSLKVTGKGRKPRRVYMGRRVRKIILDYLDKCWPEIANGYRTLFPPAGCSTKAAMGVNYLSEIMRKKMDEAGIPRANSSAHRLRHTFAVNFIRGGGGVFHLQRLLGHSSLTMTKRYVKLASEDLREAHRTASPIDNMNFSGASYNLPSDTRN